MECPFCSHDNIEGVDECARCGADLTDIVIHPHQDVVEDDLLVHPIGELVARDYVVVAPDLSVRETVKELNGRGHHCALVVEGDTIVGIFTERDVLNKLADSFDKHAGNPIREYMTPDPETLEHDVPVAFGLNRMMVRGFRHIPVVHGGKLAGMLSVRDVLAYLGKSSAAL